MRMVGLSAVLLRARRSRTRRRAPVEEEWPFVPRAGELCLSLGNSGVGPATALLGRRSPMRLRDLGAGQAVLPLCCWRCAEPAPPQAGPDLPSLSC
jgi:hypothetical protein